MNEGVTRRSVAAILIACLALLASPTARAEMAGTDPLPSGNDGPVKKSILDFVAAVTKEGGPDFVPVPERIATFDNDGTLWVEQPTYVQVAFARARIRTLPETHPECRNKPVLKAAIEGDFKAILAGTPRDRLELVS